MNQLLNQKKPLTNHEKTPGVIHLDMFEDSYIDWLKCESDIKVEESTTVKSDPSEILRTSISDGKMSICDNIQDVRSLSEHSPSCQLWISFEKGNIGQSPQTVMQCCISPTNQTASLEVATPNSAIEIAPISTQSTRTSVEDVTLHGATSEEQTLLHVAMP